MAPSSAAAGPLPMAEGLPSMAEGLPSMAAPRGAICSACGYDIGGLDTSARCPECSAPIAKSMGSGYLDAASPQHLGTLRNGLMLVLASWIFDIFWFISMGVAVWLMTGPRFTPDRAFLLPQLVELCGAGVSLLGWWMLTERNPAAVDANRDVHARVSMRVLVVVGLVGTLIGLAIQLIPALRSSAWSTFSGNIRITSNTQWSIALICAISLRGLFFLVRILRFFVGLDYLKSLAARIPSAELIRSFRRQLWLFPVLMTFGWIVVVGPLIGIGLYLFLLFRLWLELGVVRAKSIAAAGTPAAG